METLSNIAQLPEAVQTHLRLGAQYFEMMGLEDRQLKSAYLSLIERSTIIFSGRSWKPYRDLLAQVSPNQESVEVICKPSLTLFD